MRVEYGWEEQSDLVEIITKLKPIAVIKG